MFSLALDHSVVASAWEYEVGGGSIFSAPHSEHSAPNVSLDLSLIEASTRQPQQPASSSNATAEQCTYSNGMEAVSKADACGIPMPELLLGWNSFPAVPLLGSPCAPVTEELSLSPARQQCQLVPDVHNGMTCTAALTNICNKVAGQRPAAELPLAKRPKHASTMPAATCSMEHGTETQQVCEGIEEPDVQCGMVPDALAGPIHACSCCSSDSSSGHAPGSASAGSAVAGRAGNVPSAHAPAPTAAQLPPATPAYMKLEPGLVPPMAAQLQVAPPPSATPANQVGHINSKGAGISCPAASVSQLAKHVHDTATAVTAAGAASGFAHSETFPRTRAEALARFREKRARRSHAKKIRYHLRKVNADKRPRVKGRFVKKEELAKYTAEAADGCGSGDGSSCWGLADFNATAAAPGGPASGSSIWEHQPVDYYGTLELQEAPATLMMDMEDATTASAAAGASDDVPAASMCADRGPAALAAAAVPESTFSAQAAEAAAADHADATALPELFVCDVAAAAADVPELQLHDEAAPIPVLGQLALDFDALGDQHDHLLGADFFADTTDAPNTCNDLHFNWRASQGQ